METMIDDGDVVEAFSDDELPIEDWDDKTIQIGAVDLVGKVAVRDQLIAQLESRAAWHSAEAVSAELAGDKERASDERDSHSDLNAYVRGLRRHKAAPPPTPWDKETAKVLAVTDAERRFFKV